MPQSAEVAWTCPQGARAATVTPVLAEAQLVECIEARRPAFRRMAAAMLGDESEAEDVVQDAALKALRGREGFRGQADVCTWFHRICLNTCYESARRLARRRWEPAELAAIERRWTDPSYTVDPEAVALAAANLDSLRAGLQRLTPDQRLAVVLHDVEGWPVREIADTAGLPIPTVKSHLRRGRMALVSLLAGARDE